MTRLVLAAVLVLLPALARAQESKSSPAVVELLQLLDEMKLDTVAAADGGGFVGALYAPGSQLIVVRGTFASPVRAEILIDRKMYRDLYGDLNSAAELATKIFISDLGADGLKFRRANNSEPFDTADVGDKSYRFDGDWGKQKLSRDAYTKAFQDIDEQYARMLQALIAQLKKPS
jgi:hypothetical protein